MNQQQLIEELDGLEKASHEPRKQIIMASLPLNVTLVTYIGDSARRVAADIILNDDKTWEWA